MALFKACPSNTDCPFRASRNESNLAIYPYGQYENYVISALSLVELVVVLLVYQKIRPSFSSYLLAVPIHTVVIVLLLYFGATLVIAIEENESFRGIVGLCSLTQGRQSNGDCASWCEDPSKRAIVGDDILKEGKYDVSTYRCMDGTEYEDEFDKLEDDIDYLGNGWYENSVSHLGDT